MIHSYCVKLGCSSRCVLPATRSLWRFVFVLRIHSIASLDRICSHQQRFGPFGTDVVPIVLPLQ